MKGDETTMKITIEAEPKEIAALVVALQERQKKTIEETLFRRVITRKPYSSQLSEDYIPVLKQ